MTTSFPFEIRRSETWLPMNPAPPVTRTFTSDRAGEMTACELLPDNVARRPVRRRSICVERIEQCAITGRYACHVVVTSVEQHATTSHAAAPQARDEFRGFDRARV